MDAARHAGATLPDDVVRTAIQWRLKLDSAEDKALVNARIQRWCQQQPNNALAWQRLGGLQQEFDGYAAALPRRDITIPVLQRAGADLQRRKALKLLMLAVAVGGPGSWLIAQQPGIAADYAAGTGDRRRITLADGTQLLLNTRSAVDVRFSATERLLVLREGEVQINSTADPSSLRASPLRVQCQHGLCETLGARFVLRDQGDHSELLVQQGEIEVTSRSGQRLIASHGEHYALRHQRIDPIAAQRIDPTAWTRGMLVVNDIRLGDFVQELARYRSGIIGCDPAVAGLRLSGVFQLDQPEALLDNLSRTLPVSIVSRSRFWVRVVARV
ncbi:MAG TPA: DUF4880 domain-containing protein [Pseudomonas sabulinigri]|uniref:FecR protein domain-containing protein n=1 Tax=marine sediment metagenome TaxID=412755 RepID=A0A0F9MQK2_9ZZZZ|nr:DUF4880 domain-containing protein [Halopseudomonas sabulinigri]HEC53443.1 DUF4880 domain-containing protein [Halopseudomonas sabulinigri]